MEFLDDPKLAPIHAKPQSMLSPSTLSAQDFAELKYSLPEAGRWHELHDGQTVLLSAPDDLHGTIVLNISRALAEWFRTQPPQTRGYACHDLGLHVHSEPDTVYVPAMSIFREGKPFSQFDNVIATEIPRIVIDVASSHDRRSDMRLRTTAYLKHGVECVWVPDPFKKEIQVIRRAQPYPVAGEVADSGNRRPPSRFHHGCRKYLRATKMVGRETAGRLA